MNLDEQIDKLKNTLENIFKEKDNINFILITQVKAWEKFKNIFDIIIDNVKNNLIKIMNESISVLVLTKIQNTNLHSEMYSQHYLIIIQTKINIILNKVLGISKILTARIQVLEDLQKNLIQIQDQTTYCINESLNLIANIKTINFDEWQKLIKESLINVNNNQSKLKYVFQKTVNESREKIQNIRDKILNNIDKDNGIMTTYNVNSLDISYLNDVIKNINNIWNSAMIDIVKAKTDTINKIANDRSKRQTNNSVQLDCHHHQNKKLKV